MAIGIVSTTLGKVSGVEMDGIYAGITQFRNIPYAAPPVGELRFAPPQPPEKWDGVRPCDTWPDAAVQNFFPGDDLYIMGRPNASEDCLYLNITTGAQSGNEKRPVYLWYHDGGLTNGFSFDPRNDPMEYVRKGLVFVSVGHRLGEMGYMALPQLTAEQGQSGNYGVMDTIMALKWVHDNIAAFGGDPDNVTIGGESGGCAKVCALAAIPEVRGMFRRVINESGLYWLRQLKTLPEAEEIGLKFLDSVGIARDVSLEELRSLPTEKVHNAHIDPHFLPGEMTIDGKIFDRPLRDCFFENIEGLDFLNCVCAGEAEPGVDRDILAGARHITNKEQFFAHFRNILGDLYDEYDFESLVNVTDENAWAESLRIASLGLAPRVRSNAARSIMIDRIFGDTVEKTYGKGNIYTARFSHMPPHADNGREHSPVTNHGADNVYASVALRFGLPESVAYTETDRAVADMFNDYIVNFVKTGNPNGGELPFWPRSNDDLSWMDICSEPCAHSGLEGRLDELIKVYAERTYDI